MILDSLYLKNIRSYKELDIVFQKGTTLFEGDIGSGKSTILMAIEFALFGLGNIRGNSLLRTGEKEGLVRLGFTVNKDSFQVQRKLVASRKSARQSSDGCYLKTENDTLYLSPTELKAKVLDILNFNEPTNPRAKSVIFTYAVFTPQEEMKTIIFDNPDRRLQTLRKAFRIEDYKTATENASSLASHIESRSKELKGAASTLEENLDRKKTLEKERRNVEAKVEPLKQQEKVELKLRDSIQKQIRSLRKQQVEISRIAGQIPLIEKRIQDNEYEVTRRVNDKRKHEETLSDLQATIGTLKAVLRPTDQSLEALETEIKQLTERERRFRGQEVILKNKIQELQSIEARGVCPTCERPAISDEFKGRIQEKIAEKEKVTIQVNQLTQRVEKTRKLLTEVLGFQNIQQQLKSYSSQWTLLDQSITNISARIQALQIQINDGRSFVSQARGQYQILKEITEKITELECEDQTQEKLLSQINTSLASVKQRLKDITQSLSVLDKTINHQRGQRKRSDDLSEHVIWIHDFFIPTLRTIETSVLANIQEEFNEKFREWFAMLVEDTTKDARIDEDFTPLVEQDGYEHDLRFLSGGEKTSVALAYRLALNRLVQKISTGMTSNLLILDEPTDGFSREQLFKVRDILNELQCPQTIIVSHEKELESFADNIFRINKNNGISEIH
jgi:exonuclease SbcC